MRSILGRGEVTIGTKKIEYIIIFVLLNLVLVFFSSVINKNKSFEKLIFTFCFGWLFMINFFESLIFISANIFLLSYGIYKHQDKLIRLSVVVLAISIEQIIELEDLLQVIYYIVLGIIFILINKYLMNRKK